MDKEQHKTNYFWRIFAIIALTAFCVIGYYSIKTYSISNRYIKVNPINVLDKWTGEIIDVRNHDVRDPFAIDPDNFIDPGSNED